MFIWKKGFYFFRSHPIIIIGSKGVQVDEISTRCISYLFGP